MGSQRNKRQPGACLFQQADMEPKVGPLDIEDVGKVITFPGPGTPHGPGRRRGLHRARASDERDGGRRNGETMSKEMQSEDQAQEGDSGPC